MAGELLRYISFFGMDACHGSPVARHLRHIRRLLETRDLAATNQKLRLRELLRHACATTSYYRQYEGQLDLSMYPVVAQSVFRTRADEFTTGDTKLLTNAMRVMTSGSYGMPLIYELDRQKFYRRRAEILFYNGLAGYRVGERLARVHCSRKLQEGSTRWFRLSQNIVEVYVPTFDPEVLRSTAQRLARGDLAVVIGWPSMLLAVARAALGKGIPCRRIEGVISYGEVLGQAEREELAAWFGCQVLDRYATTETGVIAHELPGQPGRLWVNSASYNVELLDLRQDRPALSGEPARIVITDLYNLAMPLIRYDTGDIAIEHGVIDGRTYIGRIDGRFNEIIYNTKGEPLPQLVLYSALNWKEKKRMQQFQIVQTGYAAYEVRIVEREAVNVEAIRASMREVVGSDANIDVRFVEEIERLGSGKQAVMLNRSGFYGNPAENDDVYQPTRTVPLQE